jgi:tetratricopeptide (TPR) repeat protein
LINLIYQVSKVFVLSYDWLCAQINDEGDVHVLTFGEEAPPVETMTETLGWATCDWTQQKTARALVAILHAYIWQGNVAYAPRQHLPVHLRAETLATLLNNAEKFVVAHEYAHVLLGHCEESLTDMPTPVGTLSAVVARTRAQEFEADELAANLLLASSDWGAPGGEFDVNSRVAGIALLFSTATMLAVALKGPAGFGMEAHDSDDHPTPNARMVRLLEFLHRKYGRSGTHLARVCMGWMMANMDAVVLGVANLTEAIRLEKAAQAFYDQQQYVEAVPLLRRIIAIRESELGDSDLSIAAPLSNLANCLIDADQLKEAEELFIRSLAICEDIGSLADHYLATSLYNLATYYANAGRDETAEPFYQRSLKQAESRLGLDSKTFAICVHGYLGTLETLNRDEAVEELCKHSVAITRHTLGEEHGDFLFNVGRLARLYEYKGRYRDAVPLREELVVISRQLLSEQHPEFALALNNLAYVYKHVGRFDDAETHYKQAMEITRKKLGDEHPDFALQLNDLGLLYEAAHRLKEAEQAFKQVVEIMTASVGADDPNTKMSLGNLERVLRTKTNE